MKDNISLVETEKIEERIQRIMRQTNYSEDLAREKLQENNYDEILTIKSYLGIPEKKNVPIKSINQEIYKQLRTKLNANMRDYQERSERGEINKIQK